jgi:hypothetical protein
MIEALWLCYRHIIILVHLLRGERAENLGHISVGLFQLVHARQYVSAGAPLRFGQSTVWILDWNRYV